jgi:NAD(P)-dependent dehydrogenase (short-subunit alcohol dehydrogenase family)
MERPLVGTVAIVTGASRGLGRSFAVDLAECGASLTVVARSAHDLDETVELVRAHDVACETVVGDVRDDTVAADAIRITNERLGPPSMLVNNAGIAQLGAFVDVAVEDWWNVLAVNLRAPIVWIKAVLPTMRQQGHGRIINVSSPATTTPLPYISSYGAAKAALTQFTACLAPEVAADGIVAIAIGPAALTAMTRNLWETDGLPPAMQDQLKAVFTADPDSMLRRTLDLFRCIATGGADHLSGQYLGSRPGSFDTPETVATTPPPAGQLLTR